jgi:branched-chain amino acid transport system substrate-binding protein
MRLSRRLTLSGAAISATLGHTRAATPTIRIGVLTDLSGQYRDNSGPTTVLAAKQAVEDFNSSAHGFAAEVIAADHQQKPDVGAGIARQWFDRDGVDMVADVNNTAIALAVGRRGGSAAFELGFALFDESPAGFLGVIGVLQDRAGVRGQHHRRFHARI